MLVFSKLNNNQYKTDKDATISNVASFTGLNENHVKFLYESQLLDNILNQLNIVLRDEHKIEKSDLYGFTGNVTHNELNNKFSIYDEVLNILNKNELSKEKIEEVNRLTEKCKQLKNIDSVDLLNGIATLLMFSDEKAKQYILGFNNLHEPNLNPQVELRKLNESSNMFDETLKINFSEDIDSTKYLFENIKDILKRQNKRWGNSYRLDNTYNGIMNYLETEINQIQINNEITTVDSDFHLYLLKDFVYGNNNPLYRDYNSIKSVCGDIQTLIFDMVVLIAKHINDNQESLKFLSRDTFKSYINFNNILIKELSSSVLKSKIINQELKNKLNNIYLNKDEINDELPLITEFINNLDNKKFNEFGFGNTIEISHKSAIDMLWLINSTTPDFNLKLRPIIKSYVTKAMELINKVQKTNFELIKFKNKN